MSLNGYITIVPYSTKAGEIAYAYLEANEWMVPNTRARDVGILPALPPGATAPSLPVLQVMALGRCENLSGNEGAITRMVAATQRPFWEGKEIDRKYILVDTTHFVAGPGLAKRVYEIQRSLGARSNLGMFDLSKAEVPSPVRQGWRTAIGSRAVAASLWEYLREKRFKINPSLGLAQEARQQIRAYSARPTKDEVLAGEDHFATAAALCVWFQERYYQTKGGRAA